MKPPLGISWLCLFHTACRRSTEEARSLYSWSSALRSHRPSASPAPQTAVPLPNAVLSADLRHEINKLVRVRAEARWKGDYDAADQARAELEQIHLPNPSMEMVLEDIPRRLGGGTDWKLQFKVDLQSQASSTTPGQKNVLNLAHAVLGMAASKYGSVRCDVTRQNLVDQAKHQLRGWYHVQENLQNDTSTMIDFLGAEASLSATHGAFDQWILVESSLRGRKAADAAFWFALAGVDDEELYDWLVAVAIKELRRFGERPSCRPKDVLAVVDRLAAAGVRDNLELEALVRGLLQAKETEGSRQYDDGRQLIDLHSDSCALMIWKFSTRQKKQKSFLETAALHWASSAEQESVDGKGDEMVETTKYHPAIYDWKSMFADVSRPLVVDVGCGMGVSLLGLASQGSRGRGADLAEWPDYNFLGVDLSSLAIGYANSIAKRWNLTDHSRFVVDDSTRFLTAVADSYPGPVAWVLIQFPTPYRLPNSSRQALSDSAGNSQLPSSATDGFMVTEELMRQAGTVLSRSTTRKGRSGRLLLQSNCEDVAVYMQDMACNRLDHPFVPIEATQQDSVPKSEPTQRSLSWRAMGGNPPSGPGWWYKPVLPRTGRTETEVACMINRTPVHRCVLESS